MPMKRINLDQDIQPLSEFRAGVSKYLHQVNESKRPLVITQHGKGVAVLLDVVEFELMQQKLELLEDIQLAEAQIENGQGIPHEEAKSQILKSLGQ